MDAVSPTVSTDSIQSIELIEWIGSACRMLASAAPRSLMVMVDYYCV